MSGWGAASGWDDAAATAQAEVNDTNDAPQAPTTTDEHQQSEPTADGEAAERTPAQHGWTSRTQLDYAALGANGEAAGSHEESGAIPSWAHNAARYEWVDEYGEVGPRVPELEAQLFTKEYINTAGEGISAYRNFTVTVEGGEKIHPVTKFADAGLHPTMLENVQLCHYDTPTPVQAYTIPACLTGNDVVSIAQTGSGKTAAYLVPVLSRLMGKAKRLCAPRPSPLRYNPAVDAVQAQPLVLIICPTRELAMQIFDDARRFCYRTMLRPAVLYGGGPMQEQLGELKRGCDVLIGTPGRLKDVITTHSRWLSLDKLKYTIIDEADELLSDDWEEEMKHLLGGGAANMEGDHQFMMFSATFDKNARSLARKYLADDYVRIRVGRSGSTHANIRQDVIWVDENQKQKALNDLLLDLPPCRTLIFVNATQKADIVDDFLYNMEFPVTSIHAKRTQREREDAIRAFRRGTCPVMVATAISARGLDIKNVMHVINYDLPSGQYGGIGEYVHRIGRTARIGNSGQATSFYNERNEDIAEDLVKLLVESNQNVPDFLADFKPDGELTFDDTSDAEEEEGGAGLGGGDGGAWGAGGGGESDDAADNGGGDWGAAPVKAAPAPAAESAGGWGATATDGAGW